MPDIKELIEDVEVDVAVPDRGSKRRGDIADDTAN